MSLLGGWDGGACRCRGIGGGGPGLFRRRWRGRWFGLLIPRKGYQEIGLALLETLQREAGWKFSCLCSGSGALR
jgi:hypothetical protein